MSATAQRLNWKTTTFLLCAYGAIKELRPAVPFLTPYLVSPVKNFTDVQLYSQIYPFWTYSYLVVLIPVFFLTDLLRYKPVIVFEALGLIGTWALLLWGVSVFQMQLMQIVFGAASAAEIAYYSYIYGAVDDKHYKRVTSYVRGAALCGKTFAYATAQVLISTKIADYLLLNYISFVSVCSILLIAVALPSLPKTKAAVLDSGTKLPEGDTLLTELDSEPKPAIVVLSADNNVRKYFHTIWRDFKSFLSDRFVLKWSIWWSLASCGMFQVWNYAQPLWAVLQNEQSGNVQNGVTECVATLLGAGVAFSMQFVTLDWSKYGEIVLFIISVIDALLLFFMAKAENVFLSYGLYIIVCGSYQMLITVASHNIASRLQSASYGLVFGWNTFVALLLQTILTLAVADERGFALDIRAQFVVYALYYAAIAVVFLAMLMVQCCVNKNRCNSNGKRDTSRVVSE
uniref:Uncharacterized protein n=1 Tax=Plectus sambesii TaxID=2011161 RepID=A0A914WB31_9BILA